MKKFLKLSLFIGFLIFQTESLSAINVDISEDRPLENTETNHNWKKTSSEFKMVHADSHDYDVWRNFIKKTVTCDITHKIKTEIWYCDLHNHTKSEVSLEETIHSHKH